MALRRSGVRIPLGPHERERLAKAGRSCAIVLLRENYANREDFASVPQDLSCPPRRKMNFAVQPRYEKPTVTNYDSDSLKKAEFVTECGIICKTLKVTAGVVGHPVSEKGKRGGSPSFVSNGNTWTELACPLERETALVNVGQIANLTKVVSDGLPVIASKWCCANWQFALRNPGGTAERQASFVPEWMKDFLFLDGGR